MARPLHRNRSAGTAGPSPAPVAAPGPPAAAAPAVSPAGPPSDLIPAGQSATGRPLLEGAGGAVPPPHAPREVSQPLQPGLVQEQLARARANERELAPLQFGQAGTAAPTAEGVPAVPQPATGVPTGPAPAGGIYAEVHQLAIAAASAAPVTEPTGAPVTEPPSILTPPRTVTPAPDAGASPAAPPAVAPLDRARHPAGSDTESPSRGVPQPSTDPGKQITGGFGGPGQGMGEVIYNPLDGQELRVSVEDLLQQVYDRIQNDLRFTIATVYPRVNITVTVQVETHDTKPAGGFAFSVQQLEIHPQTEASVNPPDKIRDKFGLDKPMKQRVRLGAGHQIVDKIVTRADLTLPVP